MFYEKEIIKEIVSDFSIPYTTMNIGKIDGGEAINIIPDNCKVLIDFRIVKSDQIRKIESFFEEKMSKYKFKYSKLNVIEPFITKTMLVNDTKTCNFITEGSFINKNRIILGVGPINPHESNEYITSKSLKEIVKQYEKILKLYQN